MQHVIVLRYGELGLKGRNRAFFIRALVENVRAALAPVGGADAREVFDRVVAPVAAGSVEEALRRASRVFGVVSASPAVRVPPHLDSIGEAAQTLAAEWLRDRSGAVTFRVEARRANKDFPLTSMDVAREIGTMLQRAHPNLVARMHEPDLTVGIDVREAAYLWTRTVSGPGGLPVGTAGRAMPLLSGGIDSPVAAWLAARRGVEAVPVHFQSFPYTSERAKEKVVDLCRVLASYTGPIALHVVPFTATQEAIQRQVPDALRVLVARRMFMRIAERLSRRTGCLALVTGESLGQVASQTLESLGVIEAATTMPVLRPLVGWDKSEIVAKARELGTYEISVRPYEDCCSLFVPAHPRTRPDLAEVEAAERELPVDALADAAAGGTEVIQIAASEVVPA